MKRTWLFVPADDEAKIAKALASNADAIIFDLEDGVGPDLERKNIARHVLAKTLAANATQRQRCYVRINELAAEIASLDLSAAVVGRAAGVVLPKCEGPVGVAKLSALLDAMEASTGHTPGSTAIVAVATETARGMQLLAHFTEPLPRLEGLMWGAEDLCADLAGAANRDSDNRYLRPYLAARDACLIAARAINVSAIDAVYTAFRDSEGLNRECQEHYTLGFDAKAAIHPAQLPIIEAAFTPTPAQCEWAERVLRSFENGAGVQGLDGVMLDMPHLKRARQILGLT